MTLDAATLRDLCVQHGISRLRVFGSYARGDQTPASDLDLIADFAEIPTLFDLARIERAFSQRLGVDVELLTERAISRYLRDRILREARELYVRAA